MAEIKFNENGQGYIDFEWLLNLTSEEFVENVKEDLAFITSRKCDVKVLETDSQVTVIVKSIALVAIHKFYKNFPNLPERICFTHTEVKEFWGMING